MDLNSHWRTAHPQNVTVQAATIAALFMGSRKSSPSPRSFNNGNILFLMLIAIIVLLPLFLLTNWSYLLFNIAPIIMSNRIIFIIFFVIYPRESSFLSFCSIPGTAVLVLTTVPVLGGWDVEQALLDGVSLDDDDDDDVDQTVLDGVSLVSLDDKDNIMVTKPFSS